jgi:hypothetical protein
MSGTGTTKWGTKIVLVVLAAACGAGAWYAQGEQTTVGARAEAEASTTAASYITVDLARALKRWTPGDAPDKLRSQLEAVVLADPEVTAVRVFDAEGALVFSSVANDVASGDPVVVQAALTAEGLVDASDATTLRTFAATDGLVGQVEQDADEIRGTATLPWMIGQFVGMGATLVLLGSALFAGNGTKAPKERSSKKVESSVKQTKKELEGDDPELAKLRARAEKAEQSRRAMEDQLNVLRSQILSGDAGSQARVTELEGHLQDAHSRVTEAETLAAALTKQVADLEATASGTAPAQQRLTSLETEVATSKARVKELEQLVQSMEARAVQAETSAAAHSGQLEEAHLKARQAELQVQEAVDRAIGAERSVGELQARLSAVDANGQGADEVVLRLQQELAVATSAVDERERALRDAVARADSADQLLAAAETRVAEALARTDQAAPAPAPTVDLPSAAPVAEGGVRELEMALADARAAAWEAQREDDRPSLGIVETHAVPEDEEARSEVPQELDEASVIRAELERMGHVVEHAGEAGDVEGLRGRLAQTAARKKGRSAVEDRITRS